MKKLLLCGAVLTLGACQSYTNTAEDERVEAEIAAKQGEQVSRICFAQTIDGWRELSDDAILVEKGVNDWYKLNLAGTCQPEWAFNAIAIETRGTSCITEGDRIRTDEQPLGGTCFVTSIYKWHDDGRYSEAAY